LLNQIHPDLSISIPALKVVNDLILTFLEAILLRARARAAESDINCNDRWIYRSKQYRVVTMSLVNEPLFAGEDFTEIWMCSEGPLSISVEGGLFAESVASASPGRWTVCQKDFGQVGLSDNKDAGIKILDSQTVRLAARDVAVDDVYQFGCSEADKRLTQFKENTAPRGKNGLLCMSGLVIVPGPKTLPLVYLL
jgi:hypothetical protein